MRKRERAEYDDDRVFFPSLNVFEPEAGLQQTIGFVRFWKPPVVKAKKVRRGKAPAKRK